MVNTVISCEKTAHLFNFCHMSYKDLSMSPSLERFLFFNLLWEGMAEEPIDPSPTPLPLWNNKRGFSISFDLAKSTIMN